MIGFLLGHLGALSLLSGGLGALFFPEAALTILKTIDGFPKPVFIVGCGLLAFLLVRAEGESRHWHKQSDRYERLYNLEHSGRLADRKSYVDAQTAAVAMNKAQVAHVKQQQQEITDATVSHLSARLQLIAGELRGQDSAPQSVAGSAAAGDPGATPCRASCASGLYLTPEERLRGAEDEERHQELIDWVVRQSQVNPNAAAPSNSERQQDPLPSRHS